MERFSYNVKNPLGNDNWERGGIKQLRKSIFKNNKYFLPTLILVFLFLYFFLIGPIFAIRGKFKVLAKSSSALKKTFSNNDIDLVDKEIKQFAKEYEDFKKSAKRLYWTSFISYGADFKNGVEAGRYAISAAETTIAS